MSYRKFLSLSIVLMTLFILLVPLALAQGVNPEVGRSDQTYGQRLGMVQTTPEVTGTVEATDEAATPEVTGTVEATDEAAPAEATVSGAEVVTDTTTGDAGAETTPAATTEPAGAAQATATPLPATLPATGGVRLPWTGILLVVVGGLILAGGLSLVLSRRNR